jgi:hypothetical protein
MGYRPVWCIGGSHRADTGRPQATPRIGAGIGIVSPETYRHEENVQEANQGYPSELSGYRTHRPTT